MKTMATIGTGYENFVLENKMTDLTNTKLDARSLMTIDYSLTNRDGLKKIITKYTYDGVVEELNKGDKNTVKGHVTRTQTEYAVKRYQQTFEYNDMDIMQDSLLLDTATESAAKVMVNQIKEQYFEELEKISTVIEYPKLSNFDYTTVVDALAEIGCEAEEDAFIIMGSDLKAQIRKDKNFMESRQGEILYSGQIGSICGLPIIYSKLVPSDTAYITKKSAIKFFVKKEGSVEQDRDIETKDNTVVYERHGVIALVDDTESVKIVKATV